MPSARGSGDYGFLRVSLRTRIELEMVATVYRFETCELDTARRELRGPARSWTASPRCTRCSPTSPSAPTAWCRRGSSALRSGTARAGSRSRPRGRGPCTSLVPEGDRSLPPGRACALVGHLVVGEEDVLGESGTGLGENFEVWPRSRAQASVTMRPDRIRGEREPHRIVLERVRDQSVSEIRWVSAGLRRCARRPAGGRARTTSPSGGAPGSRWSRSPSPSNSA
jgi:hypothetical protein